MNNEDKRKIALLIIAAVPMVTMGFLVGSYEYKQSKLLAKIVELEHTTTTYTAKETCYEPSQDDITDIGAATSED